MIDVKKTKDGYKVIIYKPENMKQGKWEKILIMTAKALEPLGIQVKRVDVPTL